MFFMFNKSGFTHLFLSAPSVIKVAHHCFSLLLRQHLISPTPVLNSSIGRHTTVYTQIDTIRYLVNNKKIEELIGSHAFQMTVCHRYNRVGDLHLELLQTHNLLFQSTPRDQSVDVHDASLTDTMSTIHCLKSNPIKPRSSTRKHPALALGQLNE